jgi:microcystin-dependent protein
MPGTPGPRTGLAAILTSDASTAYRTTINAVITWLESNAGISSSGLLSARPTSTPASPGIQGRKFYATDVGLEFRDTGTGWVPIGFPIGGTFGWISSGDLTAELVLADGRTLSSTSYPVLDALIGAAAPAGRTHLWNGGTSPGSGLFRIPDYRGRARVGPDNMGTARGAANVIPNSNRALAQSGGEERHTLTGDELPGAVIEQGAGTFFATLVEGAGVNVDTGLGHAHNNMQPYAVENVLVRII